MFLGVSFDVIVLVSATSNGLDEGRLLLLLVGVMLAVYCFSSCVVPTK